MNTELVETTLSTVSSYVRVKYCVKTAIEARLGIHPIGFSRWSCILSWVIEVDQQVVYMALLLSDAAFSRCSIYRLLIHPILSSFEDIQNTVETLGSNLSPVTLDSVCLAFPKFFMRLCETT